MAARILGRMELLPLGLVAGVLTTVAGMGGGMALVLFLSLVWDAPTALAVTAPALLVGNAHRAWLYRRHIDLRIAGTFAVGAVPGAMIGGLLTAQVPVVLLHGVMVVTTALAIARVVAGWQWRPPPAALVPAGGVVGVLMATSGAGAVLVAPTIMATGLLGDRYLATLAMSSIAVHIGRIAGYGAAGLFHADTIGRSALLAVAIFVGNLVGQRIRRVLPERTGRMVELATLGACTMLALAGIG